MCSRSLSLSSSPAFLPCCFFSQIVFSLLLATHQLHPHHLSKLFAYSLLITFPSFLQELPGASRWHLLLPCFLYSCHAHSFPTGCLWGSSHHSLQSLDPHMFSSPGGLAFKSLGLLFLIVSALPAFSLGTFHQGIDAALSAHSINTTCCSVLSRASLRHCPCPFAFLYCSANRGTCWCAHSWIFTFHSVFLFAYSLPVCLPSPRVPYYAS